MHPPRIVEVDPQGADALALLREAAQQARALYPELVQANAPWPSNPPTPPGGVYLVAYDEQGAAACGALRPLDRETVEVRRMFVTVRARGRGFARAVLRELEARAEALGYGALKLETGYRQRPAMGLYESEGYSRTEPFGEHVNDPTSVCYQKAIGEQKSDA